MKKLLALVSVLALLCAGCSDAPAQEDDTLHILATTYPVYLFTTAVTEGVEDIEVTRLINEEVSCLHDYTLTVNDMKAIEKADVIIMNGAGFEDFMSDALAQTDATVIDCSEGIALLESCHDHDGHDHEGHDHAHDPHFWLDPDCAAQMVETIATELTALDAHNTERYSSNLETCLSSLHAGRICAHVTGHSSLSSVLTHTDLITFHDGFQYFAAAFDLELLKSIEEEEGSEASAAEIKEIVALIEEHDIPAIFTEKNGSDATAQAIARETGVAVYPLNMIMSGEGSGIQPYIDAMNANLQTIAEALGEKGN